MKPLSESAGTLRFLASSAGLTPPSGGDPLEISSSVLSQVFPAGLGSPTLPQEIRDLELTAHAAQLKGRALLHTSADPSEGLRWLELATEAAFVSGADTNRAEDHLIMAAARHRRGDFTGAALDFSAAHSALRSQGRSSVWSEYSDSTDDNHRNDLASRATDFPFYTSRPEDSTSTPARAETPAESRSNTNDQMGSAFRATVSKGAQAINALQEKIDEYSSGELGQNNVERFNQRFNTAPEAPATDATEATVDDKPAPLNAAMKSLLEHPNEYPSEKARRSVSEILNDTPPDDALATVQAAQILLEGNGHFPLMARYLAGLEYELATRLDDSSSIVSALSRMALLLRNAAQSNEEKSAAFEMASSAKTQAAGLPVFPDQARPAAVLSLLFLTAGILDEALAELAPPIEAGQIAQSSDAQEQILLGDLYAVLSRIHHERWTIQKQESDLEAVSRNHRQALALYNAAGQPDGFERARVRYQL
ncbi:hypothetical protein [Corynebacterium doosanense]|uniref:Uncharacterized protein n=1 Tax=Corynebacterium doosanense CAU 212 = DSM 45436 TaxID=558173 RepID=A0A097IJ92_9CORY|nr:hypothetical protein [Corynebacterium doosanense]AIT62211.1 hypothetical protein CDOO_02750 [Corynebacterium doosanense CAU 212 = DSM 45436]